MRGLREPLWVVTLDGLLVTGERVNCALCHVKSACVAEAFVW